MMQSWFGNFSRWLLLVSWCSAILYLSLDPSPPVPKVGFLAWDKFQHASAYGLLTLFGGLAGRSFISDIRRRWLTAAFLSVLYGCLLEVAQAVLTVSRTAEFGDVLADAIGAGAVLAVALRSHILTFNR